MPIPRVKRACRTMKVGVSSAIWIAAQYSSRRFDEREEMKLGAPDVLAWWRASP